MKSSFHIFILAFDLATQSDLSLEPIVKFHPMITGGLELADLWFHLDSIFLSQELQSFLKVLDFDFLSCQ